MLFYIRIGLLRLKKEYLSPNKVHKLTTESIPVAKPALSIALSTKRLDKIIAV